MIGERTTHAAPRVGQVVRDTTVEFDLMYLIGTSGFMALGSGAYVPYDSAFPGPSFFDQAAFEVVDEYQPPSPDTSITGADR